MIFKRFPRESELAADTDDPDHEGVKDDYFELFSRSNLKKHFLSSLVSVLMEIVSKCVFKSNSRISEILRNRSKPVIFDDF